MTNAAPGLDTPATLSEAALAVLLEPSAVGKVARTRAYGDAWSDRRLTEIGCAIPPARPARPPRAQLCPPRDMPKRRKGGAAGRAAFVHAIAHIELNAIDLAWDIVARFTGEVLPQAFYDDWVSVALDEAEHFAMLSNRLAELGYAYGDLPAHDGLWQAATDTADDLLARLAVVPMILEARGLDTTPDAVRRLSEAGDHETATILETIGREEIPHVAAGVRWFEFLCERRGREPVAAFHDLVRSRFNGVIKAPFNHAARRAAGMAEPYYAAA